MKLTLYSLNFAPELTGIGKYNSELTNELEQYSVHTTVVTAQPYYPEWKIHKGFKNFYSLNCILSTRIFRVPLYVPSRPNTFQRLFHLGSFAISSFLRLLTLVNQRPDILVLVQPTLFCAPGALIYSKLTGAKSILHIQDFEVDAMFGLGLGKSGFVSKFAKKIESWLYKRFDYISSISYSMLDNAKAKGVDESKLLFFPNWADIDFVTPEVDGSSIRAEWGFDANDKVVLYSGNIGQKQGLEVILEAAKKYQDQKHIKFVIIGNGVYRQALEKQANSLCLDNIYFKPLQPWEMVPKILATADIHLVVQKKGAADAVLPSKLTNILSVGGHALVTAESHTELGKIAKKFKGIFTLCEPENTQAFIDALDSLLAQNTQMVNTIARNYAETYLDKEKVIGKFVEDLNQIVLPQSSSVAQ